MTPNGIPLKDRCRHRWRSLLPLFGVDAKFLVDKQGPCPICEGRTRFRFDDKEGEGTWFCNHCRAGDGFALVMRINGWDFAETAKHIEAHLGDAVVETAKPKKRNEAADRQHMNEAWKAARSVTADSPAGRYLLSRIGTLPLVADLRAAGRLFCKEPAGLPATYRPALLAMARDGSGTPTALHRTYLTDAGGKAPVDAPKRVMGSLPPGAAIRLAPIEPVLGVAEGIETALACTAMFGVPCWAAISAGQLERWSPPAGVEHVVVFGDRDESRVGERAAHGLAHRLLETMNVELRLPDRAGMDWADVWARDRSKQAAA